jgi:hypothetical protein
LPIHESWRPELDENLGIAPNWVGSITFKTAGAMYLDTTNSSATFEIAMLKKLVGDAC